MTEYQERRAQYLRDAHDWAEDGDLPDASADYTTVTVEADAGEFMDALGQVNTNLAHAKEIRQAYLRGRADERTDERTAVVAFLIAVDPDEWDPEDVARAISDGDHVGEATS